MMNSKFVAERSRSLAQKILEKESADADHVSRAFRTVLGRSPTSEESAAGVEYVNRFPAKASGDDGRLLAWSSFCRALIASNDYIYVH
jgi:hypothetical protein